MRVAQPCIASSTELSTTSQTRWCSPLGPVDPMYIPGRCLTGSRPGQDSDVARVVRRRRRRFSRFRSCRCLFSFQRHARALSVAVVTGQAPLRPGFLASPCRTVLMSYKCTSEGVLLGRLTGPF